jgi:hypothetical protein
MEAIERVYYLPLSNQIYVSTFLTLEADYPEIVWGEPVIYLGRL